MNPHWTETLGEIERQIDDCLASLDRYEAAFAKVLNEQGVSTLPLKEPDWDATLADATRSADEVEQLFAEQDGVWLRWRESLARWHGLIEQPA